MLFNQLQDANGRKLLFYLHFKILKINIYKNVPLVADVDGDCGDDMELMAIHFPVIVSVAIVLFLS